MTGYATQKKESGTQASTSISSETIQNLEGQVSGLSILSASGETGSTSKVILRGVGSINDNAEPLFVVDGVPVSENEYKKLATENITSVNVLKAKPISNLTIPLISF